MPRDGSNIYSQPFPNVEEATTIESTVYNGFTNDIAADLNAPRPIVAGGTGATSVDQALVNLGGEKAAMLVTNYDSFVWQAGSFYSAVGATGAPPSGGTATAAFSGIAYGADAAATPPANQNVVLEARDATDNKRYIRRKSGGAWGAWILDSFATGGVTTTGGYRFTAYNAGTLTAGQTYTPDAYNGNYQYYTNNGAHTVTVPANDCALDVLISNGASAGAITFSGYTVSATNTGDLLTTTNTHKFIISIRRINNVSTYVIKALQ